MARISKSAPLRPCGWQEYGQLCGRRSMYLVQVPHGSYYPYCLAHVTRVIVHATDEQYHEHPAGQREPVAVLPVDQR